MTAESAVWEQFAVPLAVNVLSSLLAGGGRFLFFRFAARDKAPSAVVQRAVLLGAALLWILATILTLIVVADTGRVVEGLIVLGVPTATVFVLHWREVSRVLKVGIYAAASNGKQLTAPGVTLKRVNERLDFLGTGASKLTSEEEFERAALRVTTRGGLIRLLLARPDAVGHQVAARRAGRPHDEYERNVRASLEKLARLQRERSANIEVRFYDRQSVFRLMRVSPNEMVVSFNVYGSGSATALNGPALRLRPSSDDAVGSFYWAFSQHFENQWEHALPWDPQEFM